MLELLTLALLQFQILGFSPEAASLDASVRVEQTSSADSGGTGWGDGTTCESGGTGWGDGTTANDSGGTGWGDGTKN
ncbi:hypothetical protein F0P96_06530 [Hymenobacter busanensis]|uniref:Uncharacterized protein n=1 Tax=Hymenobacter busanensis TaxID=2607656 RepID=A0A7L5A1C5_9BACT|nr:hypothetical protein [Hymenobacter busanensis]KAA9338485.1 hypothetical protein F0P96_06530 [Hymenobacter busanensis]QHJ09087.1 hypothetical protein GUY19_18070 [Hymenobacter busanensis]